MDWGTELWVSPLPPAPTVLPCWGPGLSALSPMYLCRDSAVSTAADPVGPRPLPSAFSFKSSFGTF